MPRTRPTVLSIAGYDPCGGAGLLADIKTFEANKVYGLGVISAITWQNESSFEKVEWLNPNKIISQIALLLKKSKVEFVKIGLIENVATLHAIVHYLTEQDERIKIIWDPILGASAGFDFHSGSSLEDWKKILPKLYLVIPNWQEASWLSGGKWGVDAALYLAHSCHVFLKGGHNPDKEGYDYLFARRPAASIPQTQHSFKPKQKNVAPKHGSGCVLSAGIVAYLAKGYSLHRACLMAKTYTGKFLASNESLLGWHKL